MLDDAIASGLAELSSSHPIATVWAPPSDHTVAAQRQFTLESQSSLNLWIWTALYNNTIYRLIHQLCSVKKET